jgi:hypothetical protein
VPPEALSLALAASIYPPALAAVIALGRGSEVRLRVILFVAMAYATVFFTGSLILLLFTEAGASADQVRTPSATLYLLLGLAILWLSARLRRDRAPAPAKQRKPSTIDRYLQSRKGILLLGVILYVVPSPIMVAAVKAIADAKAASGLSLVYLAQMLLVMLWLIELPLLMLIVLPDASVRALEGVNAWFRRHGRMLAVWIARLIGVYLIAVALAEFFG